MKSGIKKYKLTLLSYKLEFACDICDNENKIECKPLFTKTEF